MAGSAWELAVEKGGEEGKRWLRLFREGREGGRKKGREDEVGMLVVSPPQSGHGRNEENQEDAGTRGGGDTAAAAAAAAAAVVECHLTRPPIAPRSLLPPAFPPSLPPRLPLPWPLPSTTLAARAKQSSWPPSCAKRRLWQWYVPSIPLSLPSLLFNCQANLDELVLLTPPSPLFQHTFSPPLSSLPSLPPSLPPSLGERPPHLRHDGPYVGV